MSRDREHARSPRKDAEATRGRSGRIRGVGTTSLVMGLAVVTGAAGLVDPPFGVAQQSDSVQLLPGPTGTSLLPGSDEPAEEAPTSSETPPEQGTGQQESSEQEDGTSAGGSAEPGEQGSGDSGAAKRLPPPPEQRPDVRPGPGRIWTLTASTLTLEGVHYNGFATHEVNGEQVRTMHFTVDALRIGDLVQRGRLAGGKDVRVAADRGSVSTITEGPIELYTRKLTGKLNVAGYPLVPVELSPEALLLPNLDLGFLELPKLTFSDAVVRNVDLDGGKLFIPGAEIAPE
ncbi:hypothetical protein [Actinopolyspora saharensis]|uniref:Uncharacterized protein n=1 Tax=Actinopolyspora saharensis TaxID=995062 RepID=A0A1H1DHS9_9ACTN|nr:hypothetical protein [Actinopolyspora saharensis]SDQ76044.1 hypothetical protein SAMN04489718_2088 [Actinopolyspora saharensis]